MVGCGGFGAANAGAAIIVSAAAKEPAIVALAITFLEFMGVSFPGNIRRCGSTRRSFHHRLAEESDDGGARSNPSVDVTPVALLHYRPPPSQSCDRGGILR